MLVPSGGSGFRCDSARGKKPTEFAVTGIAGCPAQHSIDLPGFCDRDESTLFGRRNCRRTASDPDPDDQESTPAAGPRLDGASWHLTPVREAAGMRIQRRATTAIGNRARFDTQAPRVDIGRSFVLVGFSNSGTDHEVAARSSSFSLADISIYHSRSSPGS